VKSRRGAPKRVNTEGFACPNRKCPYFGITDAHIHALVGDGKHGCAERIQTFRCQACHTTFTARRHTALYRLKTPSQQIARVLSALAEGLDPSAAERVFGYRQATITSLSDSGWRARADLARTLLPQPPHLSPSTGRTAHEAALRQTGALALADHRPLHQDSSCAPSGSPHAEHGTPAHPLPATDPGSRPSAALHQ
jgi:transposase-like protein